MKDKTDGLRKEEKCINADHDYCCECGHCYTCENKKIAKLEKSFDFQSGEMALLMEENKTIDGLKKKISKLEKNLTDMALEKVTQSFADAEVKVDEYKSKLSQYKKLESNILSEIEIFLNNDELPELFSNEGIEKLRELFNKIEIIFKRSK